jgi:hypothetical protein
MTIRNSSGKKVRHLPRQSGAGARQVLIPGKRKAVPHWLSKAAAEDRTAKESAREQATEQAGVGA